MNFRLNFRASKNPSTEPRQFIGKTIAILTIILLSLIFFPDTISAQDNLLNDPGFEGNYTGRGRGDFNIPDAWGGWWTDTPKSEDWMNSPPIAFPHTAEFKRSGSKSLSIERGSGTFTAAIFQQIPNVPAGTPLQASVHVLIRTDDPNADARVRIGIGTGTDPNGAITWSGFEKGRNGWKQIGVSGVAPGGDVTVFVYMTQTWPSNPNAVYIDDASLVATGTATNADGNSDTINGDDNTEADTQTSVDNSQFAPAVQAQEGQNDGFITHVVQSGDTLSSIGVAYSVSVAEIMERNGIEEGEFLQIGQELVIKPAESVITDEQPQSREEEEATEEPTAPESPEHSEPESETPPNEDEQEGQSSGSVSVDDTTFPPPLLTQRAATQIAEGTPLEELVSEETATLEPTATTELESAEATSAPTATATLEPTEEPSETELPSEMPTVTLTSTNAPTATDAPPAPVISENDGGVTSPDDLISSESSVCVLLFEDTDINRIRQPEESLLANGEILLRSISAIGFEETYTTDGLAEPYCFESLQPGDYLVSAVAPVGYGLTTSPQLQIVIRPGIQANANFGAAPGVQVAIAPTADGNQQTDVANNGDEIPETNTNPTPDLFGISGILVLGLAAVVLVFGMGLSLILRRR